MKWFPTHLRNPLVYHVLQVSDTELVFAGAFEYNTFPIERVLQLDDKTPPKHIEILGKVEDPNYVSATTNILRLRYRVLQPRLDQAEALQVVLNRIEALEPAAKACEDAHEQANLDAFTRQIRAEYNVWMKECRFRRPK